MRILILEDDKTILQLMQIIFCDEAHGNKCDTAISVNEARQLISKNRYDMILADLMIDGEPCLSFIEEIRSIKPKPKICVMSAWVGADKIVKGSNVDCFLSKPFDIETIEKMVTDKNR